MRSIITTALEELMGILVFWSVIIALVLSAYGLLALVAAVIRQ